MRRCLCLLLISGCCVTAGADEPTVRKVPPVSLPLITQEAEPAPLAVTVLPKATWFIVQSIEPVRITGSRDGFIKVREHVGAPEYNFIGLFVDSGGEVQERTYPTSPEYNHVYSITSVKPGEIELLVITPTDILRQTLVIEGPRPPPDPDPKPDPKPDPQPVAKNVSMAIVEDTMNRSPDTAILMNGLVAWTEFVDSGNDWRAYDLKTGESRGKKAITDINGSVPGIVIYAKPGGQMIHRGELPATFGELKALIARLTGG